MNKQRQGFRRTGPTGPHKAPLYSKLDLMKIRPPTCEVSEGRICESLLDDETAACIDIASQAHPNRKDKIRARKRYVTASAAGKAGIDEALHQRRLRRLKALWDPE